MLHTWGDHVIAFVPNIDTLNTTGKQCGFVLGLRVGMYEGLQAQRPCLINCDVVQHAWALC